MKEKKYKRKEEFYVNNIGIEGKNYI